MFEETKATYEEWRWKAYGILVPQVRVWDNHPLPDGVEMGEMGYCYHNALQLMISIDRPNLSYVEGWVEHEPGEGYYQHAYCVDRDGRVIDPTWPYHPDRVYEGVPMCGLWVVHQYYTMEEQGGLLGVLNGIKSVREIYQIIRAADVYQPGDVAHV